MPKSRDPLDLQQDLQNLVSSFSEKPENSVDFLKKTKKIIKLIIQETIEEIAKIVAKDEVSPQEDQLIRTLLLDLRKKTKLDEIDDLKVDLQHTFLDIKSIVSVLKEACFECLEGERRTKTKLLLKLKKLFSEDSQIMQKLQRL